MGDKEESSKGKGYLTWDTEMDKILGTCLVDQVNQGNKLDGRHAWKTAAWTAAVSSLAKHCGKMITKQNVLSRLKTWEKHYDLLSPLLLKSGAPFSWDYSRNRIQVHEESVWKDHVKANPKLVPYLKKIEVENWDDICVIFSQDRANGEGAKTASEVSANPEVEVELVDESTSVEVDARMTNANRIRQATQKNRSLDTSSSSRGTKRKCSDTDILCKSVSKLADSVSNYFNLEAGRAGAKEILDELKKVPNLDINQTLKCIDFLRADPIKFGTFCQLPDELKLQWLLMHLQ